MRPHRISDTVLIIVRPAERYRTIHFSEMRWDLLTTAQNACPVGPQGRAPVTRWKKWLSDASRRRPVGRRKIEEVMWELRVCAVPNRVVRSHATDADSVRAHLPEEHSPIA